jgi:hypothetical protein
MGSTTNPPTGYTHGHQTAGNQPFHHPHNFSPETQQHWDQYPGGQGQGTMGYTHTHGNDYQLYGNRTTPGGRNGMNKKGRKRNGPGPSTSHPPYRHGSRRATPVIKEPVAPKPTAAGGGSIPNIHSNFVLGSTGESYTGPVINMGGIFYTVPNGNTRSADSEQLIRAGHDNIGPVRNPNAAKKNAGSF